MAKVKIVWVKLSVGRWKSEDGRFSVLRNVVTGLSFLYNGGESAGSFGHVADGKKAAQDIVDAEQPAAKPRPVKIQWDKSWDGKHYTELGGRFKILRGYKGSRIHSLYQNGTFVHGYDDIRKAKAAAQAIANRDLASK